MGRPGEDGRDQRHRDEVAKERLEELEEEQDVLDDLIGNQVDNSIMAGTADAVRAQRGRDSADLASDPDEMFEHLDLRDFIGAPPSGSETAHDRSTADEDESEDGPSSPQSGDEDDAEVAVVTGGDTWLSSRHAVPAPATAPVLLSDWLKKDD